ncbi:MAG TPA: hypothetical protein VJV79_38150 [Polyangiaceae bacterium]|nr:hypothetical protein [Polyangiaceae bacterium]
MARAGSGRESNGPGSSIWLGALFVAGLIATSQSALAAEPTLPRGVEEKRLALLAENLDRASGLAAIEPYLPAAGGTLCAAGAVALAASDAHELYVPKAALVAPIAGCAVASFGSYALAREYQGSVVAFSLFTAVWAPLTMEAVVNPELTAAERVTLLGFAGGYMSLGTLRLLDALLERPVSWTAMAADARELRAHGAGLSRAEVRRMEADFRRAMVRPVPRWAYGAAVLMGGLVALTPALVPSTSNEDRGIAVGLSAPLLFIGSFGLVLSLAVPDGYQRYVQQLSRVQLTPLGPNKSSGLWASGSF